MSLSLESTDIQWYNVHRKTLTLYDLATAYGEANCTMLAWDNVHRKTWTLYDLVAAYGEANCTMLAWYNVHRKTWTLYYAQFFAPEGNRFIKFLKSWV